MTRRVRVVLSCGHWWVETRPADLAEPVDGELRACGDGEHYPMQFPAAYFDVEHPGCVFCQLIADTAPRPADYRKHDGGIVSFTPLHPVVAGHRLFVPVVHVVGLMSAPGITANTFGAAAVWAQNEREPCNLISSDGEDATQTVRHLHVHYVPRSEFDGLRLPWS